MDKPLTVYATNQSPPDETQPGLENLKLLLRLFVGGGAEAVDELLRRIKERQRLIEQNAPGSMTIVAGDERDADRLRYLLLGLLFEAPHRMVNRLTVARQKAEETANFIDHLFSPLTNSALLRPLRQRHEARVARLEALFEQLIDVGRSEETVGRRLARETFEATLDEVFDYMGRNPELRQILQQQSVGLTDEVVDQLRDRAAVADTLVDRIAGAILRRSPAPAETVPPDVAP